MPIDFTAIAEAFKAAVPFIPATLRLAFIPYSSGRSLAYPMHWHVSSAPVLSKFSLL